MTKRRNTRNSTKEIGRINMERVWKSQHIPKTMPRPREVANRRLTWAGYAWRKTDAMINAVIKEELKGKRPLGRLRFR